MFQKRKRLVDPELLEAVRKLPCMACYPVINEASDPHHLKTRGSGGHDIPETVLPLCRGHHTQAHSKGLIWFADSYPLVKTWLLNAGWEFDHYLGKWIFPVRGGEEIESYQEEGEESREEAREEG